MYYLLTLFLLLVPCTTSHASCLLWNTRDQCLQQTSVEQPVSYISGQKGDSPVAIGTILILIYVVGPILLFIIALFCLRWIIRFLLSP